MLQPESAWHTGNKSFKVSHIFTASPHGRNRISSAQLPVSLYCWFEWLSLSICLKCCFFFLACSHTSGHLYIFKDPRQDSQDRPLPYNKMGLFKESFQFRWHAQLAPQIDQLLFLIEKMTNSEDSGDSNDEQGELIVNLSELTNNLTRTPLALSEILKTVRIGCSKIASFHPMILSMFSAQLLTENRFFICLRSISVSRTHSSKKRTESELFREIRNNAVHKIYTFCYPRGLRELWACWYSPKTWNL